MKKLRTRHGDRNHRREYLAAMSLLIGETLVKVFLTPESKGDAIWMSITFGSALWYPVKWVAM